MAGVLNNDQMKTLSPLYAEIPYQADSCALFSAISGRDWAIFLDSGSDVNRHGRFDILSCDPFQTLISKNGVTTHTTSEGQSEYREEPFSLLQRLLPNFSGSTLPPPFHGGAMGYFSYDLSRQLEKLSVQALDEDEIPDMALGVYDWAIVVDHQEKRSWIASNGYDNHTREQWSDLVALFTPPFDSVESPSSPPFRATGPLQSNLDKQQYAEAFRKIKRYIHEGDCYQVNLAQRFSIQTEGSAWGAYQQLRKLSSAPFGAYLNFADWQVLCNSPERFLEVVEEKVESKPIKGTLPRHQQAHKDKLQIEQLKGSTKDRAENLMIVDLLRNDLSKNCALESIKVPKLFEVESYASVHHLVSTIEGRLGEGRSALELLRDSFPGGSITGAPKLRAMEVIEELEPHRRGIYCGSIGYFGFDGNMDCNISIRTMTHRDGQLRFWAGGGIVADSAMQSEYQETYDKVAAMLELLRAPQN